jgi:hypothetical protein
MTTKKGTQKKGAPSTRAPKFRDLAEALSFVMKHPETPAVLYNAMTDVLTDMWGEIDADAPDIIERSLEAYAAREERRRGGER